MKNYGFVALIIIVVIVCTFYFWPNRELQWHEEQDFKWAALKLPWFGQNGFKQLMPSETGIGFSNHLTTEQITKNRHLLNGSGVAVGDVDGDGLADIYFCRLDGPNVLYKNRGNWKFEEATEFAGVACEGQFSTGAALADIDGDSDLDLLVTTLGGPNFCFLNNGRGKFADATHTSGLIGNSGATTMALADIDGDDDLDLYIANYKKKTVKDMYVPQTLAFKNVVRKIGDSYEIAPEFEEHYTIDYLNDEMLVRYEIAEPDMLYLNDGNGHFEAVSFTDGRFWDENGHTAPELKDWGLTVRFQDMDGDGDPDIYVCNDFESPDRVWINDGKGNFQALPGLAMRKSSWATMGIDFSDIDRDGDLDFLLLDMLSRKHHRRKTQRNYRAPVPHAIGMIDDRPQYSRNTLFLNRGDMTYAEIAQYSGIQASGWSWSPFFLDVDLDGYEDIIISTGHFHDALDADALNRVGSQKYMSMETWQQQILTFPELRIANVAFRNRGNLIFEDAGAEWGLTANDITNGMALGDLDNDGDLDMVANRFDAYAGMYRNESTTPRLAVRLQGLPPNTQGIGAKILVNGGPVSQSKEVICAGTYLSSSDPIYMFASGDQGNNLTIEVAWRSGKKSLIENARTNRIYEIYETGAETDSMNIQKQEILRFAQNDRREKVKPYFEDVSHLIQHKHHEDKFDDFQNQLLLPKKLSQLGPGIAWHDIDGDGDDDLLISSGKGGSLACYRNIGSDGFQHIDDNIFGEKSAYDQTAILGWWGPDSLNSLLVGSANLEERQTGKSFVWQYALKNAAGTLEGKLEGGLSSTGPMALADYDLDGDLDLFVGGRAIPDRYPEPASSRLYHNVDGAFQLDTDNSAKLNKIGLVSGAVFSDIDADGDADLVLAVEWGQVTVFRNENGALTNATEELGLSGYYGWWQGVATGDLNEDGKLDIIATNWGLNSLYHNRYSAEHPLKIYYSDFDKNGTMDIVDAYFEPEMKRLVPERDLYWLQLAMPNIRYRIPDNETYSMASIHEIIGPRLKEAGRVKANTLAHTVFFNRGNHFEAVALPAEAQFAPAFYAGVADFDGDGHEDVFISQNFFALQIEDSRLDAGRGLWLKGNGSGSLVAVPGQVSGVKVYGEQRGAALSDYDQDGRVDLVVSQNGAATKLYHNVRAKPGLRVRLAGQSGNRQGAGATIRLVYADGMGPARELHLGSGYWSQDSMVQVMGVQNKVQGVWVRWPGGKITNTLIPERTSDVTIRFDGDAIVNF